ncbi:hypothetical protein N9878_01105 [bacterium]|nr:hypothetical protein [bacterium]
MEEATARLDIEVFVDCPHCGNFIDLMRDSDTNGYDHNEEGLVLEQACPDGYWIDEHKKFEVSNVTCSECKKDFNVKGLEW